MAGQQTRFQDFRTAGRAALIGCGLLIFFWRLDGALTQLSKSLGTTAGALLGILPSVLLTVWQPLQAHSIEHGRVLTCFLHTLVLFWPLLLVTVGAT
jgi:hypothetical protein